MSQEHLKTMVYAKFERQTKCIIGNVKIVNARNFSENFMTWCDFCTLSPGSVENEWRGPVVRT